MRRLTLSGLSQPKVIISARINMKMPKNLGMLLLSIWLILYGLLTAPFLSLRFAHSSDLLAILAIAAGVLLLLQR
jgi:hypothetical protein